MRCTAWTKGAIAEATHGVKTTGIVMLIERQTAGRTIAFRIAQLGMEAQRMVAPQPLEVLSLIVQAIKAQIAAGYGGFQKQAL